MKGRGRGAKHVSASSSATVPEDTMSPAELELQMLGIRSKDGTDVSTTLDRLFTTLEGYLKRADASSLINETAMSDCTIRVTIDALGTLSAPERETRGEQQSLKDGAGHSKRSLDADPTRMPDNSGPLVRRARLEGVDGATLANAPQPESGHSESLRLIRAHAAILAIHSRYFHALLTGGWKEDSQKTVDVRGSSVQEFEDLELLIKLAYGPSYVMLDSQPLEKDVLLRLLPLADSFEFLGFLDACINSLREELTAEEAYLCLEAIPASLQADVRLKMLYQDASDVIAEDIGDLHQLLRKEDEGPCRALLLKTAAALPEIMASSLAYRVNPKYVFDHHSHEPMGPVDRGGVDEHRLTCPSTPAECLAVQEGEALSRCAGLAGGYPISVTMGRGLNGSPDTITVDTQIQMPSCSRPGGEALGWLRAKVRCDYPGVTGHVWEGLLSGSYSISHQGLFKGSSWSQVMCEGSSVFREESLSLIINIWYPVDVRTDKTQTAKRGLRR